MEIMIANHLIGSGHPVFVIAEAGVNHNGDPEVAWKLIDAALEAGADAVKFQTFKTEKLLAKNTPKAAYQVDKTGGHETQFDMIKRLELSDAEQGELFERCKQAGITFLSSAAEEESLDFLNDLGVPAFKFGSAELTNLPFLRHAAAKGKPIILSTGMGSLGEVETAVRAIEEAGDPQLLLLHCVSNYPAEPGEVNLRAMKTLEAAFGLPVGYSDHTMGPDVALAAVAMGACLVEKHFTLDRGMPGPDHQASMEPGDLKRLVSGIRAVEAALGNGRKTPVASEAPTAALVRKSLQATRDLPAGTLLGPDVLAIKRPGTGLAPDLLPGITGMVLCVDVPAETPITWDMLK